MSPTAPFSPQPNAAIAEAKRQARQAMKSRLAALRFDRLAVAAQIFRNLERFPQFADAQTLALYLDFRNEAPTRPFLPRLFDRRDRVVAAPLCVGRELDFYRLDAPAPVRLPSPEPLSAPLSERPVERPTPDERPRSDEPTLAPFVDRDAFNPETAFRLTNLAIGAFGIWEPIPDPARFVPTTAFDVVLVPGLAFDLRGGRLGRGAGFYDRFLAALPPRTRLVGIALDEQIVVQTPRDAFDLPVDALATPSRLVLFR